MKTIFTNGCFDILHIGHVELLKFCSTLGDKVIVGLNSDASVSSLKGPDRPINDQVSRKNMLLSLKYVDDVLIFDESTPHELIKKVSPDIIVKGGDYIKESVVGNDIAQVIIFDTVEGYSTSKTILDQILILSSYQKAGVLKSGL